MAKRKKAVKPPAGQTITITVPKEWEKYDQAIIQGIIEATLAKGPKFGISKVIVQTAEAAAPSMVPTPPVWDKLC
jgi:hypothetical protein